MKVVEFYIMRRITALFLAALLWVLAIVWTTQVLNRIDLVTDSGQSATTFFTVAALVLPTVIPVVMPFAIGIGVSQTLATMNADSEMVVMSAAGSPRSTIIKPVIIVALIACVLSLLVNNTLEPYSRQKFRELIANSRADLITTIIQEGTFQKIDDNLYLQVGERLPSGQLGQIFVADTREKNVQLIYYAKHGATITRDAGSILVMQDGVVQRKNAKGDISNIHFDSYAFDLSEFTQSDGNITLFPKDRYFSYLMHPDPNDHIFQSVPQFYRGELHKRLSDWLYPLVFALIGIAVAGDARSFREARLHPMITVMTIALVVRWAGFYAANEIQTNPVFDYVVYAVPIIASLTAIGFIATNTVMELPVRWTERLIARTQKNLDIMMGLRLKLAGYRRGGGRGGA